MFDVILHITTRKAWNEALRREVCVTASLAAEGFIHFSIPTQAVNIANFLYKGQQTLVLLCILPERLTAELRYEAFDTGEPYPHLYGPLNLEAVIKIVDFLPHTDGTFGLPEDMETLATQSPRGA